MPTPSTQHGCALALLLGGASLLSCHVEAAPRGGSSVHMPTVTLNNKVEMPAISLGTWQLNETTTEATVKLAIKEGFNHIDTAWNYHNQNAVGRALKDVPRDSYFLTTKIPNCRHYFNDTYCEDAFGRATEFLAFGLKRLALSHVDLMLLHFPDSTLNCTATQEQWRAIEKFYAEGKAKAIGVSNFCPSTLACLAKTMKVTPAVNQIQYHIGMPLDQGGIRSTCAKAGITVQAYSPLGDGTAELITGPLVTKIGAKHKKSGAQVSLRYLYQLGQANGGQGMPLSTKTIKAAYMKEDLEVLDGSWSLDNSDMAELEAATTPAGNYSFMCTK